MDRRDFLKLAGALSATAAVDGCTRGREDHLTPYLASPGESVTPGVSVQYATTCRECPAGCGLVARVRDGRAYQVEGNPEHPVNRGGICLRGQSSLQGLYNPDRFRQPLLRDARGRVQPIRWDEAQRRLESALAEARGRPAAWIGDVETGAPDRLVDAWLAALLPSHTRLRYEPLADEPLRAACGRVFGRPILPFYRIQDARMLLGFGAEFLETWVSNVEYARAFGEWRAARAAGRHRGLYVHIAPRLSLTGANADEWLPIRPGTEGLVARALATLAGGPGSPNVGALAMAAGVPLEALQRLARAMAEHRPFLALPLGLSAAHAQATEAEEAILRLNLAGGAGLIEQRPHALGGASSYAEVLELIARMRAGEIGLALVHRVNPAFTLPPAAGFLEALANVPVVISFASFPDETAQLAGLVLPDHTFLESWGEYSPWPGVTGLMQPVVGPVFDTRQTEDVLLAAARALGHDLDAQSMEGYLRRQHPMADTAWISALQTGGLFATVSGAAPGAAASPPAGAAAAVPPAASAAPGQAPAGSAGGTPPRTGSGSGEAPAGAAGATTLSLLVYPSLHFYDGRTANRPWAQEIPEPLSKAVWGSWAEIHPEAARALGAADGDVLDLSTGQGRVQAPALVTDRLHPSVVAIQLGQGHTDYGRYATSTGVNPLALLPGAVEAASGALIRSGVTVQVARLPGRRPLVVLQTGRCATEVDLAQAIPLGEDAHEDAHEEPPHIPQTRDPKHSLYLNPLRGAHHWGMVIDLDRCIGCNACAAACYAENNVPVVGREQCRRGREMSWLRIENYVSCHPRPDARATAIDLRFLPMLCQHCQNAPCEYVCPVNATVHNDEGINQQVYNRCVGTRYCSNNCPYKVRRFNFFSFEFPFPLNRQLNPDVTVRKKGVMEKCSFCIQRIRAQKIAARAEKRPLRDGEVQTACQRACPTGAIVFGDFRNPNSRVRKLADSARGYSALCELNTYPNIVYLARVQAT